MGDTLRINQNLKRFIDYQLYKLVKISVASPWLRYILNAIYLKLPSSLREYFHHKYSKIFRGEKTLPAEGIWKVAFGGKTFLMPLTQQRFWLDWDSAVSICGNDMEVKETYRALIGSSEAPDIFLDIGANYGTHSLLFLIHGIRTITFEPNSSCHEYFKKICNINHVDYELEPVALGESNGTVELKYPEQDTWLGSINNKVVNKLALQHKLISETVLQKTVDNYLSLAEGKSVLIKIGTEGNELPILRGAKRTLVELRPKIIFETLPSSDRADFFRFLENFHYLICELPWNPVYKKHLLTLDSFIHHPSTNFIALPSERIN